MLTKCQALFQFLRMFKCIECYATETHTDSAITWVPIHRTGKQHLASLDQEMCGVVVVVFKLCTLLYCLLFASALLYSVIMKNYVYGFKKTQYCLNFYMYIYSFPSSKLVN